MRRIVLVAMTAISSPPSSPQAAGPTPVEPQRPEAGRGPSGTGSSAPVTSRPRSSPRATPRSSPTAPALRSRDARRRGRVRAVAVPHGLLAADDAPDARRRSRSSTRTTTRTSRPTSPIYTPQYGLPACTTANGCFRKVNQTGGTSYPAANSGWALEIALDVETAHEICQNCKILLVEASSTSSPTSAPPRTRPSRSARTSISNSWGARRVLERDAPTRPVLQPSRRRDHGVLRRRRLRRRVPGGLAVRHRRRRDDAQPERRQRVRQRDGVGRAPAPAAPPTSRSPRGRRTPAARAARSPTSRPTPIRTRAPRSTTRSATPGQAGWFQVGGTSLASPLIASVYALAGQRRRPPTTARRPTRTRASLHDVTSGSNGTLRRQRTSARRRPATTARPGSARRTASARSAERAAHRPTSRSA